MRPLRLLAPCDPENGFSVLYHITSRVVEKRFIFNEQERARFLKLAKDYAVFSGFELVSWCLMSNHFHLLVRVPVQDVEAIPDKEMVERLSHILSPKRLNKIVARLTGAPTSEMGREVLDGFRKRIGHLPSYVKAIKQEFTQWFNHRNHREGTLWEGRYHSTIIEDCGGLEPENELNGAGEIARIVASYIDMNPVRAGVESDPKDCGWSSYGAALDGDTTALHGLRVLWGTADSERICCPERMSGRDRNRSVNTVRESNKRYLETHRRWLLRGLDDPEGSNRPLDEISRTDENASRPQRLTGLRGIRLLGSPSFMSRFGLAAFSQQR